MKDVNSSLIKVFAILLLVMAIFYFFVSGNFWADSANELKLERNHTPEVGPSGTMADSLTPIQLDIQGKL